MLRTRTLGELALARHRWFTPHTWTNGIGLLANLHVAAGRRRRTVHRVPVRPARLDAGAARRVWPNRSGRTPTGCCACRRAPGLGVGLDEAALARYAA